MFFISESDIVPPAAASLGARRFLRLCLFLVLFASAPTLVWAKKEEATPLPSSSRLPKSSRVTAQDETQGIMLSVDSATTDGSKSKTSAKALAGEPQKRSASATKKEKTKAKPKAKRKQAPKAAKPVKAAERKTVRAKPVASPAKVRSDDQVWLDKIAALEAFGSDEALEKLDDMAEKRPSVAPVHAARARILMRQRDTMEALDAWQRAIALAPQNDSYKIGLGELHEELGRKDDAIKAYRSAQKLTPAAKKRLEALLAQ